MGSSTGCLVAGHPSEIGLKTKRLAARAHHVEHLGESGRTDIKITYLTTQRNAHDQLACRHRAYLCFHDEMISSNGPLRSLLICPGRIERTPPIATEERDPPLIVQEVLSTLPRYPCFVHVSFNCLYRYMTTPRLSVAYYRSHTRPLSTHLVKIGDIRSE
jgi:hypothetical protein